MIYYGSSGLSFFNERIENCFGWQRYNPQTDINNVVIFSSLYFDEDFEVYKNHQGRRFLFFNGSDVLRLACNPKWLNIIHKNKPDNVACHNIQLQSELSKIGIKALIRPIFFGRLESYQIQQIENNVNTFYATQHYGREEEYGIPSAQKACNETEVNLRVFENDTEEIMDNEIKKYMGCIRIMYHDGLSQTIIKTGLMGKYFITRQNIPGGFQIDTFDDLKNAIEIIKNCPVPNHIARNYFLSILNKFDWIN